MNKIYTLSATEIAKLIQEGKLTSKEATQAILDRIDEVEDKIGAFSSVNRENALKSAQKADQSEKTSSLHGVPIALKDNIVSLDELTTSASKILDGYYGTYDATVVKKLKEANVVLVGKANMDEFAMGSSNENSGIKPVSNPWDLDRVPGGSSGGSAAAVAALQVPIALGTDTGGSVRQPAALTGTVGLKPTYGRVSRYGLMAFGSSLDQIGIIARNSEDVAKTLEIIAGEDIYDPTTADVPVPEYSKLLDKDINGLRIGIDKKFYEGLSIEIKESTQKALEVLVGLGATIVDISLDYAKYSIPTYYIISSAEASSNLSRYDGVRYGYRADADNIEDVYVKSRTEGFGKEVKRRIMIGSYVLSSGFYDAYYKKASQVRRLIKNDYQKALESVDVIITPTTPTTAFKKGEKSNNPIEMYLSDIYTVSVSLAGLPAISVPVGFVDGLPVGMQIISNYFREDLLLNVSHKYEMERGKIEYERV
ncbi:Asp-tRNA(Asn)/Glu-tRNA(Gln) amidotransferase subunit GatA [Streptobacillus felis]|uniref:Glutamyl-tRNA(Gln) amidotransferase subunit A n=1 Tax=Streptobacillus felis TaxID=1384509 RepID=A0A7Z0PGG5_9FUSO|nr:Asp-tRNA(Asn)/Glu-tRNA(Gln) amidotransferase subunit GatA [Streptobacillus felis]NYV28263.1 Asp-tRNA(Asn)/Glu-tRNA(Gln) amidotransferase subunit GatA [Streptobacillus felis]